MRVLDCAARASVTDEVEEWKGSGVVLGLHIERQPLIAADSRSSPRGNSAKTVANTRPSGKAARSSAGCIDFAEDVGVTVRMARWNRRGPW